MKNSVKFSTRRLQADKWFIPLILILAFAGFVDATYLTISHFRGTALACTISNGCETVTTSAYATLFGLPVALLGLLFYLTTFISVKELAEPEGWIGHPYTVYKTVALPLSYLGNFSSFFKSRANLFPVVSSSGSISKTFLNDSAASRHSPVFI